MDTQNKSLVSYLMNSTSRSSASGPQAGGKEPGAPGFDAFIQNDSRVARNDFHSGPTQNGSQRFDRTGTNTPAPKQEFPASRQIEARQKPGNTESNPKPFAPSTESRPTPTERNTIPQQGTKRGFSSNPTLQTLQQASIQNPVETLNGPQTPAQNQALQQATLNALMALLQNGGDLQTNPALAGTDVTALAGDPAASGSDALMQLLNNLKANPDLSLMNLIPGQGGTVSKDQLIEQLRAMDLDPDVLDPLIDALNGDAGGEGRAGAFLQALNGLMQALQNAQTDTPEEGLTVQASQTQAANASGLEKKIMDALMKAGLSEAEAQKIVDQARGASGTDSKVDGRIVLAQLAQSLSKTKAAGHTTPESQTEPATPSREPKISLDTQSTDPSRKSVFELVGEKPGSQTASTLTHEGKAQAATNVQPPAAAAVNPKSAATTVQTGSASNPTVHNVSTGGEGTPTTPGTHPVGASSDKSSVGFKPVMAETYSARGAAEKPVTTQIIEKISFRNVGNQREVHVKLDPPSLGTVRLHIASSGETVRATLVAENHAVKQTIENNLAQLKDSMHSQGVKVDSFTVLVGGNNQGQSPHQRQESVHAFRPFDGAGSAGSNETVEEVAFTRPLFLNESQTISLFA